MNTNYNYAYIFTKYTDLLQWFNTHYQYELNNNYTTRSLGFNQLKNSYATPRDVQLILLVRYDNNNIYCKIKCPINPLPVKGEFMIPSLSSISMFLKKEGWDLKEKLPISFFK